MVYKAANDASLMFAGLSATMATTFYPAPPNTIRGDVFTLGAVSAGVTTVLAAGAAIVPALGPIGTLVGGIFSVIINDLALSGPVDIVLGHEAEIEKYEENPSLSTSS